ncbi:MAG TPA: right-handed parallel beta-helix repeat-containing protein [Bacteroidales bacterium]|nr:right-handed parallel beta-helix repeat-containing protein [Bacteroidales bacterium]
MKFQLSAILIIILFFLKSGSLLSQQIYLSPEGNDSNPGTMYQPLATMPAARDRARILRSENSQQPVEIIALEGEYLMLKPLELDHSDAGTAVSPTIFRAADGAKVIFRGGVEINGFEKVNDNLWKAFVPQVAYYDSYFEQLYVNGRRATRARSPNDGFYPVRKAEETIAEKGTGRMPQVAVQKIIVDSSDIKDITGFTDQDHEDALVIFYHNWDNTRKRILSLSKSEPAFFIAGEGMKPWNPINSKSRWFIENFQGALDAPGEWFLDRTGYLYYIPLPGETIENTIFHAPILKEFIKISGVSPGQTVSNIRFENLTFTVAGYRTPSTGNEPAQAAAPVGAVITLDYASDISFTGCEIAHTGTYGLWFRRGCNNCSVSKCYLHDLGAGGIKIGETTLRNAVNEITNNIIADNNIITDGGHIFPCAVGIIIFHASDNRLTHNEISNLRYSGISAGWIWGYAHSPSKRNIVRFNHIHHLGWGELCDMGGVYTLGASEGTIVSDNLIHDVYSYDYGGWGLYTDEGSYGIVMENNLVYNCKNSGFHQHYGKENIIRNNIFAFNIRAQLQATRVEEHRSISFTNNIIYFDKGTLLTSNWHKFNLLSDYNCYWDTRTKEVRFADNSFIEWQKSGKDTHSVIADPMFTDPGNFNFNIKNLKVAKKINFKPFDYTQAGVYGSDEWKKLGATGRDIEVEFESVVDRNESRTKK